MPEWPRQHDCDEFYGNPRGRWGSSASPIWVRKNIIYITPPFTMHMGNIVIKKIPIHRLCAASLTRALTALGSRYGDQDRMERDGVTEYDGSFVYRPMRGGSHLSMHAYGAAIDINAACNPFRSHEHLFTEGSAIVECFDAEGWTWGGRWKTNTDAMHFQAANI